jgi:hypothetical protein
MSLQLFELLDSLDPGHSAEALILAWNGNQYVTKDAKTAIVYSFAGSHGVAGDRGYCFLGSSGRLEAVGSLVNERLA